ncbi:hypothetical protein DFP72DRAFT_818002, partial [Ephemerocybe angulata]
DVDALVDSGAKNSYMHTDFIKANKLQPSVLAYHISIYNADGSLNAARSITHFVNSILRVRGHTETI